MREERRRVDILLEELYFFFRVPPPNGLTPSSVSGFGGNVGHAPEDLTGLPSCPVYVQVPGNGGPFIGNALIYSGLLIPC